MNPALPKDNKLNITKKGGVNFADLHLHTIFSDGTHTPRQLISESTKAGLSAIAIVDHDTVEGVGPAMDLAKSENIELLPGVELTAEYEGSEIHILGYLLDYKAGALLEKLETLKKNRIERIYKITDKLKGMGLNLSPEDVFEISKQGTVGRLHVARAMVKGGLTGSVPEAFKKYIGDKSPAYVLGFRFTPDKAIKLIRDTGGIPVLAHPYTLNNDAIILKFIDYGLMGLEVYYPEHSQAMVNFYLGLAKTHNLLITGGSDCHGSAKPGIRIGAVKISYGLVEKLKEAKDKL